MVYKSNNGAGSKKIYLEDKFRFYRNPFFFIEIDIMEYHSDFDFFYLVEVFL